MKTKKRTSRSIRASEHVWDKFRHYGVDCHLTMSELFEKIVMSSHIKEAVDDLIRSGK